MKLYLSSNGFPTKKQFQELTDKKLSKARIGVVMAACDWRTLSERKIRYDQMKKRFKRIGVKNLEIVDLRKFYNKKVEILISKLIKYDLLWVRGGNSYFLRYVMKKSSFDKAIKIALNKGLVYSGESAGALVMGTTLRHIEKADNPSIAPKVIWKGIEIVDLVPLPHYDSEFYGKAIKNAYKALKKDGQKVVKLDDNEALMFNGKNYKKIKGNYNWRK